MPYFSYLEVDLSGGVLEQERKKLGGVMKLGAIVGWRNARQVKGTSKPVLRKRRRM